MLKCNEYGERQAKVNEKGQCFKGWETLVSISLTDKTPLRELLDKTIFNNSKKRTDSNEPLLFNFD